LRKMIFFGEQSFRRAVASFVEHYHEERPHQSLENAPIDSVEEPGLGTIECHERLGGILKHYSRAA
jgi:putative transposase